MEAFRVPGAHRMDEGVVRVLLAGRPPESSKQSCAQDAAGAQARALGQRGDGAELKAAAEAALQLSGQRRGRGELDNVGTDAGCLQQRT